MKKIIALILSLSPSFTFAEDVVCNYTTTPIIFEPYDPTFARESKGNGGISLTCNQQTAISILLNANPASYRSLKNNNNILRYNLYVDPALTRLWGDGMSGTTPLQATARIITFPIYGIIPAGQNIAAGNYSDILNITINY